MLFYLKIFIFLVTISNTVSLDLFSPNSILVTINNKIIVRSRKPRRPRRKIREQIQPAEMEKKNLFALKILII